MSKADPIVAVQAAFAHLSDDELLAELERSGDRCTNADAESDASYDERARLFLASRAKGRQISMVRAAAAAKVSDSALVAAIEKLKARLKKEATGG